MKKHPLSVVTDKIGSIDNSPASTTTTTNKSDNQPQVTGITNNKPQTQQRTLRNKEQTKETKNTKP